MKNFYKTLSAVALTVVTFGSFAQDNVGIGTKSPDNSAVLDIQSENKGLLIPRMSSEDRISIESPAQGLLVYQVGENAGFYFYNGKMWTPMSPNEAKAVTADPNDWTMTGNAGTSPGTNFLGTTDDVPLMFKTNGTEAGKIGNSSSRNVSLGYASMRNVTGTDNVSIGHFAMLNATGSVNYNVALGSNALAFEANPGNFNMAIGRNALSYNTGSANVAVGDAALQVNSSGFNNIAIGQNAGASTTTGNSNTFIGASAGFSNLTGSGNINIGTQAGYNETGSGKLYIANSSTDMPLIYGDFSAKFVSIGDVDPAKRASANTSGGYNLLVKGGILTEKVKVALASSADWADYVFEPNYQLMSLEEVEDFTLENKHLPNVPSADEMAKEGLDVNETSKMFMEKIEELTLYMIELNKEVKALKAENAELRTKIK